MQLVIINTLLAEAGTGGPQIADAIETYLSSGSLAALGQFLSEEVDQAAIPTLTRAGGVFLGGLQSAVDPAVAQGFAAIYAAAKDPNNKLLNTLERNNINELFAAEAALYAAPPKPQLPKTVTGQTSQFAFPVKRNQPVTIDPPLAWGYEYAIGDGDPAFNSVILPLIGNGQKAYEMQICRFHRWVPVRRLKPLNEYHFRRHGLSRFRIVNILLPTVSDAPTEWISAVSFTQAGSFSGSVTTLAPADNKVFSCEE